MSPPSTLATVARVTHRLAVLLAAGLPPASAWRCVCEAPDWPLSVEAADELDVPRAILRAGEARPTLEREAWCGLAAAWSVAGEAGAPLAPALRAYASSLRALADAQREATVALASPRATARVVLALPVVGVILGALMGFGSLTVLLATPVGWGCVLVGMGLVVAARAWNRRLLASAAPAEAAPGLDCDLMAIAVAGGGSLDRAHVIVDEALDRCGLGRRTERIDGVLELSQRAGVPAAELLRAEAQEVRRDARAEAQRAAAALSVRLLLPLGVCVLPAFVVLGVVPLMVAVLSSTVATF